MIFKFLEVAVQWPVHSSAWHDPFPLSSTCVPGVTRFTTMTGRADQFQ